MRLRTFILVILIFLVLIALVAVFFIASSSGALGDLLGGGSNTGTTDQTAEVAVPAEPGLPLPSPTPSYENVVVAKLPIPIGEMLTEDLLETQHITAAASGKTGPVSEIVCKFPCTAPKFCNRNGKAIYLLAAGIPQ